MGTLREILAATYRKELPVLAALDRNEVNTRDEDGRTPLMHAVLASDADTAVVRLLIERGADVNASDRGQTWSALHFAARDQKLAVARVLLDAGAAVDAPDAAGDTPLWLAVMATASDLSLLRELLRRGADPRRRNRFGVAPAELAGSIGRDDITALFQDDPSSKRWTGC